MPGVGAFSSPEARLVYRESLRDGEALVRLASAEAPTDIEDPATDATATLMNAVSDTDARIRRMVIVALGDMEVAAATDVIRGALTDPDSGVRRAAVRALTDIEDRDQGVNRLTPASARRRPPPGGTPPVGCSWCGRKYSTGGSRHRSRWGAADRL